MASRPSLRISLWRSSPTPCVDRKRSKVPMEANAIWKLFIS